MNIEKTNSIPKKTSGRKMSIPELALLEINERISLGAYSDSLMRKIAGYIYYFNNINKDKKMVQRKIEDKLFIYREK